MTATNTMTPEEQAAKDAFFLGFNARVEARLAEHGDRVEAAHEERVRVFCSQGATREEAEAMIKRVLAEECRRQGKLPASVLA